MGIHRFSNRLASVEVSRRRRIYRARIVHSETADIVVKAGSQLEVGKRISFAPVVVLEGSTPPQWRSAVIWRIDKGCLHLTRT
jgi:hypothetical protein